MKMSILIAVAALIILVVVALLYYRSLGGVQAVHADEPGDSLYSLTTKTLAGEEIALATYRGKVALVVNVASKCGLTPQYEGLEALYRELAPRGLVILAFPSNDFMGQEPSTPTEIQQFCSTNYDLTFPLFEKVKVKGEDRCEVYQLLTRDLAQPDWNFTKYLVDAEGKVRYRFGPRTKPDDEALRAGIDELLSAAAR